MKPKRRIPWKKRQSKPKGNEKNLPRIIPEPAKKTKSKAAKTNIPPKLSLPLRSQKVSGSESIVSRIQKEKNPDDAVKAANVDVRSLESQPKSNDKNQPRIIPEPAKKTKSKATKTNISPKVSETVDRFESIASRIQKRKIRDDDDSEHVVKTAKVVVRSSSSDSASEIDVNEPHEAGEDEVQAPIRTFFNKEKVFKNRDEFNEFLKEEDCWSRRSSQKQNRGLKTLFRCNWVTYKGDQCDAEMYTLGDFAPEGTDQYGHIELYRKNCDHTHEGHDNKKTKVSKKVMDQIISLQKDGKKPTSIAFALRGNSELPQNEQPSMNKIKNVLAAHKKATYGAEALTMQNVVEFVNERSKIPESEDKAFIIGFGCDAPESPVQRFCFIVSTKRLVRMTAMSKILHADATHKVTTEKLPLLVIGVSDGNKQFHLSGIAVTTNENSESYHVAFDGLKDAIAKVTGEVYEPSHLVADGDLAIYNGFQKVFGVEPDIVMCYAHVMLNIDTKYKFSDIKNKALLKEDLRILHLSASEDTFDTGCKLFETKWKSAEPAIVERLKKSFFSKFKNWYIGFSKRVPNTNNFTERFNGTMKTYQLYHQKQPLKQFMHTAFDIVEQRSRQYIMDKEEFKRELTIPSELISIGCNYEVEYLDHINVDGTADFYVFSSKIDKSISRKEVEKFQQAKFKTFSEFAQNAVNTIYKITFPQVVDDWQEAVCTCAGFSKNYMCKHIISIAHQLGLVEAPAKRYDNVPLFAAKKGKPKKASKKPLEFDS